MRILVTGGAGYIGSFMTKRLLDDGHEVLVIDSLERGHKQAIDPRATFFKGTLLDKPFIQEVMHDRKIDAIIHFAAYIAMGESMQNPGIYFENNVYGSLQLIQAAHQNDINKFIFSSTAGVYGNPLNVPIPEDHRKLPENPYGESKLMVENILAWYEKIYGLRFTTLRYFNACGASLDGKMGEAHNPETHLIPCIMRAVIDKAPFNLFGTDYGTPDGSCVRDYIHVLDLVDAHVLALHYLEKEEGGFTFNVGTGKGYSNIEVIKVVEKITGTEIKINPAPRRPGDADSLIADPVGIKRVLNFSPTHSDIETIVSSAWEWHKRSL